MGNPNYTLLLLLAVLLYCQPPPTAAQSGPRGLFNLGNGFNSLFHGSQSRPRTTRRAFPNLWHWNLPRPWLFNPQPLVATQNYYTRAPEVHNSRDTSNGYGNGRSENYVTHESYPGKQGYYAGSSATSWSQASQVHEDDKSVKDKRTSEITDHTEALKEYITNKNLYLLNKSKDLISQKFAEAQNTGTHPVGNGVYTQMVVNHNPNEEGNKNHVKITTTVVRKDDLAQDEKGAKRKVIKFVYDSDKDGIVKKVDHDVKTSSSYGSGYDRESSIGSSGQQSGYYKNTETKDVESSQKNVGVTKEVYNLGGYETSNYDKGVKESHEEKKEKFDSQKDVGISKGVYSVGGYETSKYDKGMKETHEEKGGSSSKKDSEIVGVKKDYAESEMGKGQMNKVEHYGTVVPSSEYSAHTSVTKEKNEEKARQVSKEVEKSLVESQHVSKTDGVASKESHHIAKVEKSVEVKEVKAVEKETKIVDHGYHDLSSSHRNEETHKKQENFEKVKESVKSYDKVKDVKAVDYGNHDLSSSQHKEENFEKVKESSKSYDKVKDVKAVDHGYHDLSSSHHKEENFEKVKESAKSYDKVKDVKAVDHGHHDLSSISHKEETHKKEKNVEKESVKSYDKVKEVKNVDHGHYDLSSISDKVETHKKEKNVEKESVKSYDKVKNVKAVDHEHHDLSSIHDESHKISKEGNSFDQVKESADSFNKVKEVKAYEKAVNSVDHGQAGVTSDYDKVKDSSYSNNIDKASDKDTSLYWSQTVTHQDLTDANGKPYVRVITNIIRDDNKKGDVVNYVWSSDGKLKTEQEFSNKQMPEVTRYNTAETTAAKEPLLDKSSVVLNEEKPTRNLEADGVYNGGIWHDGILIQTLKPTDNNKVTVRISTSEVSSNKVTSDQRSIPQPVSIIKLLSSTRESNEKVLNYSQQ